MGASSGAIAGSAGSASLPAGRLSPGRSITTAPPSRRGDLGAAILPLLLHPNRWIHRRVESIRFIDDETVRRQVSVDFTLPDWYVNDPRRADRAQLAPLALLKKEKLKAFDLRDERGASLPLLAKADSGQIAAAALLLYARDVALQHGRSLDEEIVRDLAAIVEGDADEEALARMRECSGRGRATRRLLGDDPRFHKLMGDLADNFIVLVYLHQPSRRRVLKFSFEEPLQFERRPARDLDDGMFALRRLASGLGWRPEPITWNAPGVGFAGSYHFEVEAARDLEITEAQLLVTDGGTRRADHAKCAKRVHLYVDGVSADANAAVDVRLRASRRGLLRASALLAVFVAAMLTAGAVFIDGLSHAREGGATIVASIPAILAAYLIRPGEHELASRMLIGVRALVLGTGVLAFLAAGSLAADFNHRHTLPWIWWSLAGCAWILAVLLLFSLLLPTVEKEGASGRGPE